MAELNGPAAAGRRGCGIRGGDAFDVAGGRHGEGGGEVPPASSEVTSTVRLFSVMNCMRRWGDGFSEAGSRATPGVCLGTGERFA